MEYDVDSILALVLVFLYTLLGLICTLQIGRIIYYRHPIRSFQFWFLFICLIWSILRTFFFLNSYVLQGRALMTIYWMPVDLQFMTFSLLVLFYAFLLYQSSWETKRKWAFFIYILVNISVCMTTAIYIYIGCDSEGCHQTSVNKIHHIYMAIQFSILVTVYGYFGYQLYQRRYSQSFPWSASPSSITAMTTVSWLIFCSRWLYNILVTIDSKRFAMELTYGEDDMINVHPGAFALLVIWEVVPSAMVLLFFRDIPRTQNNLCRYLCPNLCKQRVDSPSRQSRVLDPQSPSHINSEGILEKQCVYNVHSGCSCASCVPIGCLNTPLLGAICAGLCCMKKTRKGTNLFADELGNDGTYSPPAPNGYAYGFGYEEGLLADSQFDISSIPVDDHMSMGYQYDYTQPSPVHSIRDAGYGNGYYLYEGNSVSGQVMSNEMQSQLQAQIQAQIQAQLEQHARQGNEYYQF